MLRLFASAAANLINDRSGTITTGGTPQSLMAANSSRKGFMVQNISAGDLWINELGAATQTAGSIKIAPGATYSSPLGGTPLGAVSIVGATAAQAFTAREW